MRRRRCHTELSGLDPHPRRRRGTNEMASSWREGWGETGGLRRGRRRRLFRALLCKERGPGPPPMTKDDTAMCGGCLLPARDPSTSGAAAAPRKSSATTTSAGGGEGGYFHEYDQSLLSFVGSEISCHLRKIYFKRAEAVELLIALL